MSPGNTSLVHSRFDVKHIQGKKTADVFSGSVPPLIFHCDYMRNDAPVSERFEIWKRILKNENDVQIKVTK